MSPQNFQEETSALYEEILFQKRKIIAASFPFIAQEGWTLPALEKGAALLTLDSLAVWRFFPDGVKEAVSTYSAWMDAQMAEKMEQLLVTTSLKVREKIFWAVRLRLECLAEAPLVAKQTAFFLKYPTHLSLGTRLLFKTVHQMWILAGDTSTDYNFYTKRALLAGVCGATLLFWFQDTSPHFERTWAFLNNRIDNVLLIQKIRPTCSKKIQKGKDILAAAFKVLRG